MAVSTNARGNWANLQFDPFKLTTLAQVAMHNPEYIRQLVLST
jgi:hypothetical protein